MDDYHVFEMIGRGKYSTVYKGKKKKNVGYCAIKCVDESHKSKVLQEVRILQSLDHPKVVKCYDWYETGGELCLILEYCGGGDLRRLLELDGKLPEDTVHDFARDLISGLSYLHSERIIYCDLKPSNILFDANGRTKLGDFGLCRDISETPSSLQLKRGSPSYMAPELFRDGGAHSCASDLWALGCVVYECYAGRPPFRGKELRQLVKSILNDPTPSLPGNPSRPFADLVTCLLIKDPAERIQAYREAQLSPSLTEGDSCCKLNETPPKNQLKQQKDEVSRGVDLLRLSRIAKLNLQRENRIVLAGIDTTEDVKMDGTEMELDFSEDETPTVDDKLSKPEEIDPSPPTVINTTTDDDESRRRSEELSGGVAHISEVLWHQSDLAVQPVMPPPSNKQLDLLLQSPFGAIPPSDFVKLPKHQFKVVTKSIVTSLQGKAPISEKQNVIRYLEMLISTNAAAANILLNGPILPALVKMVKMLRQSKEAPDLRVELASLLGLLIRHSTSINDDHLKKSGILRALNEGLVDSQVMVKRFSMAAFGELLCYISTTQTDQSKATNETKTSSGGWQDPSRLISKVAPLLGEGEEDKTQLYALRTIENVSSQGGYWSTCLTTQDVIHNLCRIFRDPAKQETIRLTAGSCLVRLVRFTPPTIRQVMEKLTFKETAIAISSSKQQKNPKEEQICLNLLIAALLEGGGYFPNILGELAEDENLVQSLVSLVVDGGEVLRGKSVLFAMLVCQIGGDQWLERFVEKSHLAWVLRMLEVKEEEVYWKRCLEVFVRGVAPMVPGLLDRVILDVDHLLTGGSTSEELANLQLFRVVANLVQSTPFRHMLVNEEVLGKLRLLLINLATESPFQGRDDHQMSVVRALAAYTEYPPLVLQKWTFFVHEMLPCISTICKGSKNKHLRFYCLKIWRDMSVDLVDRLSDKLSSRNREELEQICINHYRPLYPQLMDDDDPIPGLAQHLSDRLMYLFDVMEQ